MTDPTPIHARIADFARRVGVPDVDPTAPPDDVDDLDDLDTWAAERASQRWASFVPPRFIAVDLAWVATQHAGAATAITDWSASGGTANLVLVGPVGTGKTGTALAACRPRVEAGIPARYAKTVLALDELRPSGDGRGGRPGALAELLDVHLLVLDDVGAERPTEWTVERLTAILDHRWENERPTVVTTNLGPTDLEAWIGPRAYSRLVGSGAVAVRLTGEDRRRHAV